MLKYTDITQNTYIQNMATSVVIRLPSDNSAYTSNLTNYSLTTVPFP